MKINVSEIPPEGLEIELSKESGLITAKAVSPCLLSAKIIKSGNGVCVKGRFSCKVALQCSRCLNIYEYIIESPLNIVFRPESELDKEGCYELRKDDLDMSFYRDNILDIDDITNEQLALNIPMKPLCSEQCKGICPECGADLNITECKCAKKNIDDRFKVLKRLIKKEV